MKLSGRILTSVTALGMAFQPVASVVSYAEEDNKTAGIIRWYYNGDDDYCELEVDPDSNEVTLPSEPNDKKTEIFDVNDLHFTNNITLVKPPVINVPAGVDIINKNWKCSDTNIRAMYLVYPSGQKEALAADDMDVPFFTYQYDPEDDDYCVGIDMGNVEGRLPTEYNGKIVDKLDLEHVYSSDQNVYVWDSLYLPEGYKVINKHWKGAVTGIAQIELNYDSGETELLRADDYDELVEYTKDKMRKAKFKESFIEKHYKDYIQHCVLNHPDHRNTNYNYDKIEKYYDPRKEPNTYEFSRGIQEIMRYNLFSYSYGEHFGAIPFDNNHICYTGCEYHVGEEETIVKQPWYASETGVLDLTLVYLSGEKEYLRAEDYNDYFPESGKKENYDIIVFDQPMAYSYVFPDNVCGLGMTTSFFTNYTGLDNINNIIYENEAFDHYKAEELELTEAKGEVILEQSAFDDVDINKLVLPSNLKKIDKDIFGEFCKVGSIVFKGDTQIQETGANHVEGLKEITFEKNPDIEPYAFLGCEELTNVNIDISNSIRGSSFNSCSNLMTLNNESPFNEDGSPKPEYKDFIEKNFSDADDIGFLNKYVSYRVKQAVSEAITDDMPDIVKVKSLHDKLCSMTTYDTDNVDDVKNHVDVSVFLNDSTVCEGYARAMNLMLHEAGIESCFVDTDDHAWVIVKLGDHYFHVDPTWDDGDNVKYDWFMKSDAQIDGKDSHTNWELKCPSSMHSFQWKAMPQCTDIMGDVDDNDIIDGRDASAILTSYAKTSVGGNEEVDSILADFNYDGIVDGRDASAVLTHYAKSSVNN